MTLPEIRALAQQVMATQLAARTLDQMCEITLASLNAAAQQMKQDAQRATVEDENGNCLHPAASRRPAAAMGHPKRFHCTRCGATADPDEGALNG